MTEPMVTTVVDTDGRLYWAASDSKFVRDGLEDGSLKRPGEANRASEDAATSDDHDTPRPDSGSGDGPGDDTATARGGRRPGKAEPKAGS